MSARYSGLVDKEVSSTSENEVKSVRLSLADLDKQIAAIRQDLANVEMILAIQIGAVLPNPYVLPMSAENIKIAISRMDARPNLDSRALICCFTSLISNGAE